MRRLFLEVHEGSGNTLGFDCATTQETSTKARVDSKIFAGSVLADIYSKSGVRKDLKCLSFGKWVSWNAMFSRLGNGSFAVELFEKMQQEGVQTSKVGVQSMLRACVNAQCLDRSASLYTQNNSAIAASILEIAFIEICAKYGGLEEANFVLDNIHRQLSCIMDATRIPRKRSSNLDDLVDKVSSFAPFSWMEQVGSKSKDSIYLSIFKPYGGIGLVRLGMLLHNHVISNNLKASVCFWSALADLYAEGGMLVDAHDVLKSMESSSAVRFRTLITGYALPGQCSKYMQQEGERSNDMMISGFLPWSHEGHVKEGFKVVTHEGFKDFMARTNLSRASGCLKVKNGFGRSLSSTTFKREMSTSTEKQCDEDAGEQQSPSQHQSSSQQQSSLEVPESKPLGGSSWPNPDNAASYVLMSNIYADGDRWDEVKRINEMRLKARAWKKPGKAYVEIKAKVHEFIVGDRTHQDSVNIYEKLRKIKRHMGHIGYVPNVDLIVENRSYYDPYKPR